MKASELIIALQDMIERFGDLEATTSCDGQESLIVKNVTLDLESVICRRSTYGTVIGSKKINSFCVG